MLHKIIVAILTLAIVLNMACIVNNLIQKEKRIEAQSQRIAELESELAQLREEKTMLEVEVEVVRDENESLKEEIEYLQYIIDDPMLLFGESLFAFSPEEEYELMAIAMSEAGNQGLVGKMLVMNTVINRMERDGVTVHEVIYAPNQYHTAGMCDPDEECEIALLMVAAGWDGSQGAIYFCNNGYNAYGDTQLFRFRDHWFSK